MYPPSNPAHMPPTHFFDPCGETLMQPESSKMIQAPIVRRTPQPPLHKYVSCAYRTKIVGVCKMLRLLKYTAPPYEYFLDTHLNDQRKYTSESSLNVSIFMIYHITPLSKPI